jgi:hypothetical protein
MAKPLRAGRRRDILAAQEATNMRTLQSRLLLCLFVCAVGLAPGRAVADDALDVTFFVTSDTHVCTGRDGVSPDVAKGHVWAMNNATGEGARGKLLWPDTVPSAGKRIQEPSFVLLAGDIADDRVYDSDKGPDKAWGNCWALVQELYSGWPSYKKDWSSRFPVYPGFGNHDWADHDCREEGGNCGQYTIYANRSNRVIANFIQKTVEGHGITRSHSLPALELESSPPLYSFDRGRLHVVNLNTWAGEPFRG